MIGQTNPLRSAKLGTDRKIERNTLAKDARAHCQQFFRWYNHDHPHGGIGWMAPAAVHDGTAVALTAQRAMTLDAAFAAHPLRFKERGPKPPVLPTAAWSTHRKMTLHRPHAH